MKSSHRVKYLCFLGAFVAQVFLQQTFFTYSGSDRNLQLLAAKELLEGNGLCICQTNPKDLTQRICNPLEDWPPGYSLLAAPIYILTHDWMLTARILEILGLLLVFVGAYVLWERFFPRSSRAQIAFFSFWGIAFTPFYYTTATGELALGFFLLGLWSMGGNVYKLKCLIIALMFFALSAYFRYAYFPLVWLLPGLMIWRYLQKAPIPISHILLSLGFSLLITFGLLGGRSPSTAGGQEIFQGPEKFYIEHWLQWDAFPVKAFAYMSIDGLLNKLSMPPIIVWSLKIGLLIFSLFVMSLAVYFLYPFIREFLRKKYLPLTAFHWGATAISLGGFMILGLMGALSLLQPPEWHDGVTFWTYVLETRYFALCLVGVQCLLWWIVFEGRTRISKWGYYVIFIFVCSTTLYSASHTSFRYYQRFAQNDVKETIGAVPSLRMKKLQDILEKQRAQGKICLFIYGTKIQEMDEGSIAALSNAKIISFENMEDDLPEDVFIFTNIEREIWNTKFNEKVEFLGD